MWMGMVPIDARGMVGGNCVLVIEGLSRTDMQEDVVAVSGWRNMQAMHMEFVDLGHVVDQRDLDRIPGWNRNVGPGVMPL